MYKVGFHHYALENVDSLNETKVVEVQEFDPPSEVGRYHSNL